MSNTDQYESNPLNDEVLDDIANQVSVLIKNTKFRGAWNFLQNNIDVDHKRVKNASIILKHMSDQYGNITLEKDCFLKKDIERQVQMIIDLLK